MNKFCKTSLSKWMITCALVVAYVNAARADKEWRYPVMTIPKALIENANAVVRHDETVFEVLDVNRATCRVHMAITILNKMGDAHTKVAVPYDKFVRITSLEGKIYNAFGVEVSKVKSKDFQDYSAFQSFSLYEDNRMKYAELMYAEYPYTVEYSYELEYNNLLYFPSWMPVSGYSQSAQHSSFTVVAPEHLKVRYKEHNLSQARTDTTMGDKVSHRWEAQNVPAVMREKHMPSLQEILPMVHTAPTRFKMEAYEGEMTSWAAFGQWVARLNEGRSELPPDLAAKVARLTAGMSDREKIRALYQYLQQNTRYVSVQLGIGGWQPFPAAYVAEYGYGDCKALSNFMQSLLSAVGIPAQYALIRAGTGRSEILPDFPSTQFNHAILCVPNKGDTVWLECTSQDQPFGFLGSFTSDRYALLITDQGGKMVRTPRYGDGENVQRRTVNLALNGDGEATATVSTHYAGLQYENISDVLDIGGEKQKKALYERLGIASFEISDWAYEKGAGGDAKADETLHLQIRRFATTSGKRLFMQPNLMNKMDGVSMSSEQRKFDFIIKYPYTDIDSVSCTVPEGYHLEFIPEPKIITSAYGRYEASLVAEQGKWTYVRTLKMNSGRYPAGQYEQYQQFINSIAEADKQKLVLVKAT
jgi:hypothetical protein